MNLNLQFSQPIAVPGGLLSEAEATPQFWSIYRSTAFATLKEKGVSVGRSGNKWMVRLYLPVSGPGTPQIRPPAQVYSLGNPEGLLPYQVPHTGHLAAVLYRHGATGDLSDTGTGKTYVGAALAREVKLRPFVVCPIAVMAKWEGVFKTMGVPFLGIAGWDECKGKNFRLTEKIYTEHRATGKDGKPKVEKVISRINWKLPKDAMLIYDETHRAKGYITQNARLLVGGQGIPTYLASATLAASPKDMWAAGYRLALHRMSDFESFCEKLCCFKTKDRGFITVDEKNSASLLHDLIIPEHGARISVRELGDAFPRNHVTAELLNVDSPSKIDSMYSECVARVEELKEMGKQAQAMVTRLRYRQAVELEKAPAMAEMAEDYAAEGNSVALFVCFRDTLEYLVKKLGVARTAFIHGDARLDRKSMEASFQNNKVPFIICMIQAGGSSIDLHDLYGRPRAALISPCDSAMLLRQALGRICRAGALSPARQLILYAAGTVEEKVCRNVEGKLKYLDTMNDGDLAEPAFVMEPPCVEEIQ